MSNLNIRTITGKDNQPVAFPTGIAIGTGAAGSVNNIGIAGQQGFGVGICPGPLPAGMGEMFGTRDPSSDNYGNYSYSDGSVMIWMPAFYYKWGTGANGLALNAVDIKLFSAYKDPASANAAGYALHRAFYDGGAVQPGVFVDKYLCSNNGGIASSIKNGAPLSSNAVHNPFSLVGKANFYYGAIDVPKTRGAAFFCNTRFIFSALAMLSYAHGQAATAATWCAWYDAAGVTNFPKGCNNNALGDTNDSALHFVSDGNGTYPNAAKTGSANLFARTTHNGQNCGVADLNGCMWEINPGITNDGTNYHIISTAAKMSTLTSGNTLTTDLWGAPGIGANYVSLGATFGALWATGANRLVNFGSAGQVLDAAVSGNAWAAAGAGVPLVGGVGGTNAFGSDGLWDYRNNEMCPLGGGSWYDAGSAGVWALNLDIVRGYSYYSVGCRAALYL